MTKHLADLTPTQRLLYLSITKTTRHRRYECLGWWLAGLLFWAWLAWCGGLL